MNHDASCPVFRGADPDVCDGDCTRRRPTRAAAGREMRLLHVKLRQAGVRNRTERLARVSEQIGRPVASCTELTDREVRAVAAWADRKIQESQR